MLRRVLLVLTLLFSAILLLSGLTSSYAQDAGNPVKITVFEDENSLTIFVPGSSGQSVSLQGFRFAYRKGNGSTAILINTKYLGEYTGFNGILDFSNVPLPVCFRFVRQGSQSVPPQECQDGPQLWLQPLAAADVFWYDTTINTFRSFTVMNGIEPQAVCPPGPTCSVTYVPPPAATIVPTVPPAPTTTPPVIVKGGGGGRIAFTRKDNIWLVNVDGRNPVQLSTDPSPENSPSWSPDGSKIVYGHGDGASQIYRMDADGSNVTRLTHNDGINSTPSYSFDGKLIVYRSERLGQSDIFVMNADGTHPVQLTKDGGRNYFPKWSPDAKQIAFTSDRGGVFEIFVMEADGSNQHPITAGAVAYTPVWSPDGQRIAYSTNIAEVAGQSDYDIFIVNPDGTNNFRVTRNAIHDTYPAFSPDGKYLAYAEGPKNNQTIFISNIDGLAIQKLIDGTEPSWEPLPQALP